MKHAALLLALLLSTAACGKSETAVATAGCGEGASGVAVSNAWVRPAYVGQAATAAYFTLCNAGPESDALVSVAASVAAATELHETTVNDAGVASMAPVDGIALEPGAPVALAPGGRHAMLMGLAAPLAEGDMVALTLSFKNHEPMKIEAPVRAADAQDSN